MQIEVSLDVLNDVISLLKAQGAPLSADVAYDGTSLFLADPDEHERVAEMVGNANMRDALRFPLLKQAKIAAVNAKRDAIVAGGYKHNFGASVGIRTLDNRSEADAINWLGLKGIVDALVAADQGATQVPIRDAGDATFTASAATVSAALIGMAQWRGAVMARSWALKDAIASAADQAVLDAIDMEAGWPG